MIQFLEKNLKAFPAVNFYFFGDPNGWPHNIQRGKNFPTFLTNQEESISTTKHNGFFGRNSFQKVLQQSYNQQMLLQTSSHVTLETLNVGYLMSLESITAKHSICQCRKWTHLQFCFSFFNYPCLKHACKQLFIFVRIN